MTRYTTLTLLLLLLGCASPSDVRERTPLFDQLSSKPADSLAGCIADHMEKWTRDVSTRPTANGFSISRSGRVSFGRDTAFVIDVDRADGKSRVRFYSNLAFNSGNEQVISFIRSCS